MPAKRDIPTLAAALVLLLSGLLTVLNLLDEAVLHRQMKLCDATMHGVVILPQVVPLNAADLWDGSFERDFALGVGRKYPYFPLAVRLRNQVEYSVFNTSATPQVVVGRARQLLEMPYITDYCSRNLAAFMQGAPAEAASIRTMQDAVERHGQKFLYVLTPSKVAIYPEYLPRWMPCGSNEADRAAIVPAWLALLRKAGVHVVDAQGVVAGAKGRYPFALFSEAGTHWNQVGAALAAQAVAGAIDAEYGAPVVPPFTFTWRMSRKPYGEDVDLAQLMNLYRRPDFTVPHVKFVQPVPVACRRLRVVVDGGSFMEEIGLHFSVLPCAPVMVEYFYWTIWRLHWEAGREVRADVDPALRTAELRGADVIVYEENEQLLGRQRHGSALEAWVRENYED